MLVELYVILVNPVFDLKTWKVAYKIVEAMNCHDMDVSGKILKIWQKYVKFE